MVFALILAGGSGSRMEETIPKQFLLLGGKPILSRTIDAFLRHPRVDNILVVSGQTHLLETRQMMEDKPILEVVPGGSSRQQSAFLGLLALRNYASSGDVVLIHDGARPLIDGETITRCMDVTLEKGAASAVYPSENTILLTRDGKQMEEMPDRNSCYTVQTPQGFLFGEILEAHHRCENLAEKRTFTDDCTLYATMTGRPVFLSLGDKENIKMTTKTDLLLGEALLYERQESRE